jgi:hypothetical protein
VGRALLIEALGVAQEREDRAAITRILGRLSWILWMNGKTEEATWVAERMEVFPSDADPWELAYAFLSLGSLLYEAGLEEAAEKAFTRSLEYFQFAEEKSGAVFARSKLALLKHKQGDLQEANKGMVGALEAARQLNELHVTAYCTDDAEQKVATKLGLENTARVWRWAVARA